MAKNTNAASSTGSLFTADEWNKLLRIDANVGGIGSNTAVNPQSLTTNFTISTEVADQVGGLSFISTPATATASTVHSVIDFLSKGSYQSIAKIEVTREDSVQNSGSLSFFTTQSGTQALNLKLNANGSATVSAGLTVGGDLTASANLAVTGNSTVGGNLDVTGTASFGSLNLSGLTASSGDVQISAFDQIDLFTGGINPAGGTKVVSLDATSTNVLVGDLVVGQKKLEIGAISTPDNRVLSGAVRSTSDFPDFLRPAGTGGGLAFDLTAAATDLVLDINATKVVFTTDITTSGLTAAPSSNNTCLINDTTLAGADYTQTLGEDGSSITVDAMGSELTDKVGEYVALKNNTSNELFICYIESVTKLTTARRGFFFDDSGDPIVRADLNNNEVLEILSLGFIFADNDTTTLDITYTNPITSTVEPASPSTGDYWNDLNTNLWKRYSGSAFVSLGRTFVGYVVCDDTDCLGVRPAYFHKSYSDLNTLSLILEDDDTIRTSKKSSAISVYGNSLFYDFNFVKWTAAASFETGVTRTLSTVYYLYVTEDGDTKISNKKPYDESAFMLGEYHPYESWRFISQIFNNSSDEFELQGRGRTFKILQEVTHSVGRGTMTAVEFPTDDTVPQIGEGTGFYTAPAFLPKRSDSKIKIEVSVNLSESANTTNAKVLGLFADYQTDALQVQSGGNTNGGNINSINGFISVVFDSANLAPKVFSLRAGGSTTYGYSWNVTTHGVLLGGAEISSLRITELNEDI